MLFDDTGLPLRYKISHTINQLLQSNLELSYHVILLFRVFVQMTCYQNRSNLGNQEFGIPGASYQEAKQETRAVEQSIDHQNLLQVYKFLVSTKRIQEQGLSYEALVKDVE